MKDFFKVVRWQLKFLQAVFVMFLINMISFIFSQAHWFSIIGFGLGHICVFAVLVNGVYCIEKLKKISENGKCNVLDCFTAEGYWDDMREQERKNAKK